MVELFVGVCVIHWFIKSIYNGFAIAIDCTLKVVPFGFCSVQDLLLVTEEK